MDLYDYYYGLKKVGKLDTKQLADKLGISRCHLSGLINGRLPPSFKLAIKIERVTDGEVSMMEMFRYAIKNFDKLAKQYRIEREK